MREIPPPASRDNALTYITLGALAGIIATLGMSACTHEQPTRCPAAQHITEGQP